MHDEHQVQAPPPPNPNLRFTVHVFGTDFDHTIDDVVAFELSDGVYLFHTVSRKVPDKTNIDVFNMKNEQLFGIRIVPFIKED